MAPISALPMIKRAKINLVLYPRTNLPRRGHLIDLPSLSVVLSKKGASERGSTAFGRGIEAERGDGILLE